MFCTVPGFSISVPLFHVILVLKVRGTCIVEMRELSILGFLFLIPVQTFFKRPNNDDLCQVILLWLFSGKISLFIWFVCVKHHWKRVRFSIKFGIYHFFSCFMKTNLRLVHFSFGNEETKTRTTISIKLFTHITERI